jgi:hypothetical protein
LPPKLVFGPDDRDDYTLRRIVELRLSLVFECRNCRKISQADLLDLIGRYGPSAKLGDLRPKGKCSRCGKRAADVLLKAAGTPAKRGWWPRPPGAQR